LGNISAPQAFQFNFPSAYLGFYYNYLKEFQPQRDHGHYKSGASTRKEITIETEKSRGKEN